MLYQVTKRFACFDGENSPDPETDPIAAAAAAAAMAEANELAAAAALKAKKLFTQEEANTFAAEARRKAEALLKQKEKDLNDLLTSQKLSESQRKTLEDNLSSVKSELMSKEEEARIERKKMEEQFQIKLTEATASAEKWESLYRGETIDRALLDAAVKHDAYNPSQLVILLRGQTKLIEDIDEKTKKPVGKYRPKVEFTDINSETGLQFTSQLAPEDVVKRMKELPEYGNLFKSGNVAGIGATITTGGLSPGGVGGVDVRRLASDPRAYRELRKNNPALISAIGKK